MSKSAFFNNGNKNNILPNEAIIGRQLITTLQHLLTAGDWQSSMLLRTISKQLQAHCDELKQLLDDNAKFAETPKNTLQQPGTGEQVIAYVSLFQTEGNNLQKWINTLKMLDHYSQTRPVYRTEEHVRAIIRTKPEQQREAYAVIEIKENDIIPLSAGRTAADRLGHELLTLKRNTIKAENIIGFVHGENRYAFTEGQLVLEETVPSLQFSRAAQAA